MILLVQGFKKPDDGNAMLHWGNLENLYTASMDNSTPRILNALDLPMGAMTVNAPPRYELVSVYDWPGSSKFSPTLSF
jgi:hypothetical protein